MDNELRREYERRYASEMKFFTGRPGVARAVLALYGEELSGARVVDCGCGSGRSSFALARAGAQVEAVDFSAESHRVCEVLAQVQEPLPVTFAVGDVMQFQPTRPADFVFMLDILEHVPDPAALVSKAAGWLAPQGRLVVSCPSFLNLRGIAWMALQESFDMLMSPSDATQILPSDMTEWAAAAGMRAELVAGTCYGWGWTRDAAVDMSRRIRLATRDKRSDDPAWQEVRLHEERLDAFLDRAALDLEPLYRAIRDGFGVPTRPFAPALRPQAQCEFDLETVRRYLADDLMVWHDGSVITDEFFVVTQAPWSRLGSIAVYELAL